MQIYILTILRQLCVFGLLATAVAVTILRWSQPLDTTMRAAAIFGLFAGAVAATAGALPLDRGAGAGIKMVITFLAVLAIAMFLLAWLFLPILILLLHGFGASAGVLLVAFGAYGLALGLALRVAQSDGDIWLDYFRIGAVPNPRHNVRLPNALMSEGIKSLAISGAVTGLAWLAFAGLTYEQRAICILPVFLVGSLCRFLAYPSGQYIVARLLLHLQRRTPLRFGAFLQYCYDLGYTFSWCALSR